MAGRSILIAEDEPWIALDLAAEVESQDGRVIGPTPTLAGTFAILASERVDAAILDGNLANRDTTPVAHLLIQRRIPFVIHSGLSLPEELAAEYPFLDLVRKPAPSSAVIAHLMAAIEGA